MVENLEEKAENVATELHKGQLRKDGVTPYIEHPKAVVSLLRDIGVTDENIISSGWLHDVIEDCGVTSGFIRKEFNQEIANTVLSLTRDVGRKEYEERIKDANYPVQIVKLADVVHNCQSIDNSTPEKTVMRKIDDCNNLYYSLARELSPRFYSLLLENVRPLEREYQNHSSER